MDFKALIELVGKNNSNITAPEILLNLAVTFLLSLFLFFVYQATYDGVMYSRSFNVTLVLICNVTAIIMMVIESNLALSLGMVGALSIVRFRSAVKSPKDLAFVFWGIAIGLAAGTGSFLIAVIGSIFVAIILFLLDRKGFEDENFLIIIKGSELDEQILLRTIKAFCKRINLNMTTSEDADAEIIFEARLKKDSRADIIAHIKGIENVHSVTIVSNKGQIVG